MRELYKVALVTFMTQNAKKKRANQTNEKTSMNYFQFNDRNE